MEGAERLVLSAYVQTEARERNVGEREREREGTTGIAITLHPISYSPFTSRLAISGTTKFAKRKQKGVALCSLLSTQNDSTTTSLTIRRREAMVQIQMAFSALILHISSYSSPSPALSAEVLADFRVYTDDVNKYQITIPQDWQVGAARKTDEIKSITAFYPGEGASTSNVSVVITGLGPDFTRLESFGKVDAFAETLVSGLDRSWQRPPGVAAKLIDSKAANGLYYFEYTHQKPGESRRHIYSALGMANNGVYNRLYTVTGQFLEDEADKYGSKIKKAVQSFRLS